jgi:hypothetical protein
MGKKSKWFKFKKAKEEKQETKEETKQAENYSFDLLISVRNSEIREPEVMVQPDNTARINRLLISDTLTKVHHLVVSKGLEELKYPEELIFYESEAGKEDED